MIKSLVCLLFAAAVVAANPTIETFLSEVGVDPAHQFVELHVAPYSRYISLWGWQIVSSSSACTLWCDIYSDFLLVDSATLAEGEIGCGAIRLNPIGDSIMLVNDSGRVMDQVHYPRWPTGYDSAPLPPASGSIAFCTYCDSGFQWMNWYADSTPTPGEPNNNYSVISGSVTGTGGVILDGGCVYACGLNGNCYCVFGHQTGYGVYGLGAGNYEVTARAYYQGHWYTGTYRESVAVGYSQSVGGIDIVIALAGMAEAPPASLHPLLRVSGRSLLLSGDGTAPVSVQFYNQLGSRVAAFHLGTVNGEKRIELPATLSPGVYFATVQKGAYRNTVKVVIR